MKRDAPGSKAACGGLLSFQLAYFFFTGHCAGQFSGPPA
jgi:hypothetical protein